MGEDVYCTLLMSDSYLPGAAVLAKSLRDNGTKKKLAALVTPDSLLPSTITALKEIYDYVLPVDRIASPNLENLARLDRLDLRFAFTKIALWKQIQFRKIVYLDADVVALRAPDELFEIDSHFAAAPDIGWPDIFNSGVMALTPSMSEYWSLHTLASSGTSFDGADQGLLNEYFGNRPWHRLSFTYNCTPSASYQYEPAYRHFRSSISMVHFIGKTKPWMDGRQALTAGTSGGVYKELLGKWWSTYDRYYRISVGLQAVHEDASAHGQKSASALGKSASGVRTIQQYVKGEQFHGASDWAAASQLSGNQPHPPNSSNLPASMRSQPTPETPGDNKEYPLTQTTDTAESPVPDMTESKPTPQHSAYAAPSDDWDATRGAPTPGTKPEAPNLPSARYEMSHDHELFRATNFSRAPQLPEQRDIPKPIFPWETTAPKATRVFAEDLPSRPADTASQQPPPAQVPQQSQASIMSTNERSEPLVEDPWNSFTRTNAWDDNVSIDRYVRNFKQAQKAQRQGKVQVVHQQESASAEKDFATAPDSPPVQRRRESMILTDFPDANDRPSLPVTPAPIHRQTFWGHERDEAGRLPAAQGVPEQDEWNPTERLEELRRSSLVATEDLPNNPPRLQQDIPTRMMPSSSMSTSGEQSSATITSASNTTGTTAGEHQLSRTMTADESRSPFSFQQNVPTREMPASSEPQSSTATGFRSTSDTTLKEEDVSQSNLGAAADSIASSSQLQQDTATGNLPSSSESESVQTDSTGKQSTSTSSARSQELRGSDLGIAEEVFRDSARSQQDNSTGNLPSPSDSRSNILDSTNKQSSSDPLTRTEEIRNRPSETAEEVLRDSARSQQEPMTQGLTSSSAGSTLTSSSATLSTKTATSSTTGVDERYTGAMASSTSAGDGLLSSASRRSEAPASTVSANFGLDGMRANDSSSRLDKSASSSGIHSDIAQSTISLGAEATGRRANDSASLTAGAGEPSSSSLAPSILPVSTSLHTSSTQGTQARDFMTSIPDAGSATLSSIDTAPTVDLKPLEALAEELRTSVSTTSSTSNVHAADLSTSTITASAVDTRNFETLMEQRRAPAEPSSSTRSAERENLISNTATSSTANTQPLEALVRGSEAQSHLSPLGSTGMKATPSDWSRVSDLASERSSTTGSSLAAGGIRSFKSESAGSASSSPRTALDSGLEERLAGQLASSRLSSAMANTGVNSSGSTLGHESSLRSSHDTSLRSGLTSSHDSYGNSGTGISGSASSVTGSTSAAQPSYPMTHGVSSTIGGSGLSGGLGHGSTLHESNAGFGVPVSHSTQSSHGTQGTSSSGAEGTTGMTTYSRSTGGALSGNAAPSASMASEQSNNLTRGDEEPTISATGMQQSGSTTMSSATNTAQSSSTAETSSTGIGRRDVPAPGRLRTDKIGPFDEYEIA